jgi:hypothetical protein
MSEELKQLAAEFNRYFTSGNSADVGERVSVPRDEWRTLYAALSVQADGGNAVGWMPIETAPKDGAEILGWREDCGPILIRYTSCDAFLTQREIEEMDEETLFQQDWFAADFIRGSRLEGSELPTHWMPLPPAPMAGEGEGNG